MCLGQSVSHCAGLATSPPGCDRCSLAGHVGVASPNLRGSRAGAPPLGCALSSQTGCAGAGCTGGAGAGACAGQAWQKHRTCRVEPPRNCLPQLPSHLFRARLVASEDTRRLPALLPGEPSLNRRLLHHHVQGAEQRLSSQGVPQGLPS